MEKIVRGFLIFGIFYLIFDGLLHFFNIRLLSVQSIWPQSALSYGVLLNMVYASFVFLTTGFAFLMQTDIKKYKNLIILSSFWAFFHAILLIYLSTTQNLVLNGKNLPSLLVWSPFYNQYLFFESTLLISYSLVVFYWVKKGRS